MQMLVNIQGAQMATAFPGAPNFLNLILWEGSAFIILLLLLSGTIFFLFLKDQKRLNSLKLFFASVTHELKTPLASMRLQAEVIKDLYEDKEYDALGNYLNRLLDDSQNMEDQLDRVIQLARVERNGQLNITALSLTELLPRITEKWRQNLIIHFDFQDNIEMVKADSFALEIILRNLITNTRHHSNQTKAMISLRNEETEVSITYCDNGTFSGDPKRLGQIFYSPNQHKGSGIGLYLCKQLINQMKGHIQFQANPFTVTMALPKAPRRGLE